MNCQFRYNRGQCLVGLAVLFLCFVVGCGGSGDEKKKAAKPIPKVKIATNPAQAKIQGNVPKPNPAKKRGHTAAKTFSKQPVSTDPDTYLIKKEPPQGPLYKIVENPPKNDPREEYLAVAPMENMDSSNFFLVEVPQKEAVAPDPNFRLPDGFNVLEEYGYNSDGFPNRIRQMEEPTEMVFVPRGLFLLGDDSGTPNASPQHPVHVEAFYIDVTEVSLESYQMYTVKEKNTKGRNVERPYNNDESDMSMPVLGISWGQARRYAKSFGKDLPYEAEWEKAARGKDGYQHPWGNSRAIWRRVRGQYEITPIGSFKNDISPFGVFDMAGNAQEWCLDWYSPVMYQHNAKSPDPVRNPIGPKSPSKQRLKVVRGNGPGWKTWYRKGEPMVHSKGSLQASRIGFRCVLRVEVPLYE